MFSLVFIFYSRFNGDYDKFRAIEDSGNLCAFSGEASADDHNLIVFHIHTAGISGEPSLVRGIETVDNTRQTPLTAVGMAG